MISRIYFDKESENYIIEGKDIFMEDSELEFLLKQFLKRIGCYDIEILKYCMRIKNRKSQLKKYLNDLAKSVEGYY